MINKYFNLNFIKTYYMKNKKSMKKRIYTFFMSLVFYTFKIQIEIFFIIVFRHFRYELIPFCLRNKNIEIYQLIY